MIIPRILLAGVLLLGGIILAKAEDLGYVSTTFRVMGANDKLGVEVFDDPGVPGVACYLTRARTGGITGWIGIATDTSDASIACRQVGPITVDIKTLPDKENVFKVSTSILFKTMQVVRFIDVKRNTLVYLTYSDKLIEGSPKNSTSAVAIQPWR